MTTPCFTLKIRMLHPADTDVVVIHAYDDNARLDDSHNLVDIEVHHGGALVFPRGSLYVGIPKSGGHATDGNYAKEAVLSCVAMKPGDTDSEYFESYTPAQLGWAERYGEYLQYEAERRYRRADGSIRGTR